MNRSMADFDKCFTDSKSKSNSDLQRSLRGLNFGRLYLKNGDLDTALKYVNSYLNVKPNSSEGHKLLAQVYEAMGEDETALLNYRKALDLKKGPNDSYLPLNDSGVMPAIPNNVHTDANSHSPHTSTPTRVVGKSPLKNEVKMESCAICTSNQTLLAKALKQNEALLESNKMILDLLRQGNANMADIQQQIILINESLSSLNESQTVLKDTLYDFMAQEENQAFDEYLLDDKENESFDASELLSTSQPSQWQTTGPPLSALDATKPLSELFKPPADSWQCDACYVQNSGHNMVCVSCETPKPGAQQSAAQPANNTFSIQSGTQPISFNPTFTSSTSSFKFGFNAVESNSNTVPNTVSNPDPNTNTNTNANSIFSNTAFKFGNTSSPQFGSFANSANNQPNFPLFGSQFNKPIENKANDNIFSANANTTPTKSPFQFSLNQPTNPTFDFKFASPQTQSVKSPVKEPEDSVPKETELNTSCGEVEPSNADSIYFQPVVPLPPKIEVKTGEEDEIVLFTCRARLFRFDGEWKERGVGDLKILKSHNSNRIRLLMRRDIVLKVCLNQYISKDMTLELKEDKKSFTWSAIDYSDDSPSAQIFLLRVKNPENAQLFIDAFEDAKASLQSADNSTVCDDSPDKKAELNESETTESNAISNHTESQPQADNDIEIVFMKMPTDKQILNKVRELKLPLNFYDYENEKPCSGCRGCEQNVDKFEFASHESQKSDETKATNEVPKQEESLFQSAIEATNVQPGWNNKSGQQLWTSFSKTPAPIFSSDKNPDDDTVPENPDIYFKPLIPLPDLVEVKTGEEDEEVIYCQRAKLYRYEPQTKEWKERGVGDFKILKHKTKDRYRMVLRRDQILKIACNHYITGEMSLNPMNTSETAVCWNAMDYTDGTPIEEQFALKFKNKEILLKFKQVFNDCKSSLTNGVNNSEESTEH